LYRDDVLGGRSKQGRGAGAEEQDIVGRFLLSKRTLVSVIFMPVLQFERSASAELQHNRKQHITEIRSAVTVPADLEMRGNTSS
jgi:hypothetical protein